MTTRDRAPKVTKVPLGFAAIVLLLRSTQPLPAQTIPDDFVITLERTQCFGECPVYKVSIDATGHVVYEGTQYVRVAGRQTDGVEASQVAALVATVERIGFFQLDDVYRTARTADGLGLVVSDLPTTFVTVTSQGRTKRVEDYYNAPAGLRELETQIDETARTQRWTRIEELMMRGSLRPLTSPATSMTRPHYRCSPTRFGRISSPA